MRRAFDEQIRMNIIANEHPLFMSFKNKIHFMTIDNDERNLYDFSPF